MIRNIIAISVCAILSAASLTAQPVASAGMQADARSAGFAGATVAMDGHSMSVFTNMAALPFTDKYRTQASYGISVLGHDNLLHAGGGYYRINDKHTIGIGARYFRSAQIENTLDGIEITKVQPYDLMIDLAYARRITGHLALSVNARFVNSKLNEGYGFEKASALALDLGLMYRRENYSIGAQISNAGTILNYGVAKYRMPACVKAGGAYRWKPADDHTVTGMAEARYNFMPSEYRFASAGVGAEYRFRELAAVRGGYYLASETKAGGDYAAAGAGIYLGPVIIDFAYNFAKSDSPMNKVWRLGAGVRF